MKHVVYAVVLAAVAAAGLSCGLFAPRPVEPPLDMATDPFKFSSVLENTACFFRSNAYQDVFSDAVIYDNTGYLPKTTDKQNIIQRLNDLADANVNLSVDWSPDDRFNPPQDIQGDTATVFRKYVVWLKGRQVSATDSGSLQWRLARSQGSNDWSVVYWKDDVFGVAARSLFNPVR